MTKEFSKTFYLAAGECNPQGEMPMPLLVHRVIEVATLHANSWGIGYRYLIEHNHAWVLSRITLELHRTPRVDEHYTVTTWIEDYNRHFSLRCMEVTDEQGEPIGYIRTVWMVIDLAARSSVDITRIDKIRDNVSARRCPIDPQSRLRPIAGAPASNYRFTYVDCDFNRHVNTVRYLELLMNQFDMEHYDRNRLSRVEMAFVKETHYGSEATIAVARDGMNWAMNIMVDGEDHVRAKLCFTERQ
ncbi:MAG: acyl-[Muribaculaceae bacterium]|nr:acyl-[acyl-carrier-protein] thioesterase [Muribaculaceae bacterium]